MKYGFFMIIGIAASVNAYLVTEIPEEKLIILQQGNHCRNKRNVLDISSLGITSLKGISKVMVQYNNKKVVLARVPYLSLILDNNALEAIPDEIGLMGLIISISAKNNNLVSLCTSLIDLINCTHLNISHNKLADDQLTLLYELLEHNWCLDITQNNFSQEGESGLTHHIAEQEAQKIKARL